MSFICLGAGHAGVKGKMTDKPAKEDTLGPQSGVKIAVKSAVKQLR